MIELSEKRQIEIGKRMAEILGIKKKRDGLYHTEWGRKYEIGLLHTIMSLAQKVNDERKDGIERILIDT